MPRGMRKCERRKASSAHHLGAGIGGLAAASALRQRGIEVAVYERATGLGEVGAGPADRAEFGQSVPRARFGRGAAAITPSSRSIWSRSPGTRRACATASRCKAIAAAQYGAPYMTAHRADIHEHPAPAAGDAPLHARRQLRRRRNGQRHRRRALRRRRRGEADARHRRRWHPLGDPRAAFRRRSAALHRDDGVALHGADGLRADAVVAAAA